MTPLRLIQPDSIKLLAFGDSLTEGYANFGMTFHPYGWNLKTELQKLCPELKTIDVDIEGQSGDCILQSLYGRFYKRLVKAITTAKREYDLVIILGGTNDLAHKLGKGNGGAEEIFHQGHHVLFNYVLENTKSNLLVLTVPMRHIDTKDSAIARTAREAREHLNDLILGWAGDQTERVFSMDLARLVPYDEGGYWSPDGLHMSEKGYDRVGELLATTIAGSLKEEKQTIPENSGQQQTESR